MCMCDICMCVPVHICMAQGSHTHVCKHACGAARLVPGTILSHSSALFTETGSSNQTQSSYSASLPHQIALGRPSCPLSICAGSRYLISGPHTCSSSTLTTEPSPSGPSHSFTTTWFKAQVWQKWQKSQLLRFFQGYQSISPK